MVHWRHQAAIVFALVILTPLVPRADPVVFFGEDVSSYLPFGLGDNQVLRPANMKNSDQAAARFRAALPAVFVETFESYAAGQVPTNLFFGLTRATLTGDQVIGEVLDPSQTDKGGFPISGSRALVLNSDVSSYFALDFPTPQIALGFYGTDAELNPLQLSLLDTNGASQDISIPVTIPQGTAGAFFMGVIVNTNPFTRATVSMIVNYSDTVWVDDLTIAAPASATHLAMLFGQVTDALDGKPLPGAAIFAGGRSVTTDAQGNYFLSDLTPSLPKADFSSDQRRGAAPLTVPFQNLSLEPGLMLVGTNAGYQTYTNAAIKLLPGISNRWDFSLSPADVPALRLVLNWGATPKDLDAHLFTPAIEGNAYEVFYATANRGRTNGPPYAQLDVDRTAGFGPETITIARFYPGTYRYFVRNFKDEGNTGELVDSKAVVQVYGDRGLLRTIPVPTTGGGDYWTVCDIDGASGAITVLDAIGSLPPARPESSSPSPDPSNPTSGPAPLGEPFKYRWDFGDGIASDQASPVHVYEVPGVYTVSLSVMDTDNQVGAEVKTGYITVVPPGPSLKVRREQPDVVIEWSTAETGFQLVSRPDLNSGAWTLAPQAPAVAQATNYSVRIPITGSQLYRLEQR